MVVSVRRLGFPSAVGLFVAALLVAGCTSAPSTSSSPTTSQPTSASIDSTTVSGVQTSTSASAGTTETSASSSTSLTTGNLDYFRAVEDLEALLQKDDLRMPELATDINRTAPDIPKAVYEEIGSMFNALQQTEMTLSQMANIPAEYRKAHDLLLQAANHMLMRINQTGVGVQDILNSGDPISGNAYFQVARNYRDYYRQTFAQYQAAVSGAQTTVTTTAQLHFLSEFTWPKNGLQPEAVVRAIQKQQGSSPGPIYLPKTLPDGFHIPEEYLTVAVDGTVTHSPNPGPPGGGTRPGYILYLSNGTEYIFLSVNFAGDAPEEPWKETGIAFEGTSFKRLDDTAFLAATVGAERSIMAINGCSDNRLVDNKYLAEALEIAQTLVRVQ